MGNFYLWLKALHIVGVIAFMAGMLYLPRLFVYHAGVGKGSPESEIFKIMERRLEKAIMRPALVVVLLSGVALAWEREFFGASWLSWKLVLVLLMSVNYGYLIWTRYRFAADANRHSARFFRIVNELPTLLLIGIVVLVVVKPA
ncbi:MAG: CopD family protein [Methylovirgula sp.]